MTLYLFFRYAPRARICFCARLESDDKAREGVRFFIPSFRARLLRRISMSRLKKHAGSVVGNYMEGA